MKILIITPRIPFPPFRGDKLKIFNIAKYLAKNNYVKIISFLRFRKQLSDLEELKKHNIFIEVVRLSLVVSILRLISSIFSNAPFQVAWFKSCKMKKKVYDEALNGDYDVIYFSLIRSAQFFNPSFKSLKTLFVIDYTDAVSLYLKRFGEIEKHFLKRFFIRLEQERVEKYEKIAEMFHTLFICSEIDRDFLIKKGNSANIKLLKNGVDTEYFKSEKTEYDINRIIFTGNMPYLANYDAAIYFVKEIFPLVLNKIPGANFYIVGQKPPRKIRKLHSQNVIVTGFVPDIRQEYLKSAVNVAPMRFGAGTLNKVIESVKLGVPVVATPMAVEGLPKELKKYVFVTKDKVKFADLVVEIIKNPSIREKLMEEGKVLIERILGWEKIVGDFEQYLKEQIKVKSE